MMLLTFLCESARVRIYMCVCVSCCFSMKFNGILELAMKNVYSFIELLYMNVVLPFVHREFPLNEQKFKFFNE